MMAKKNLFEVWIKISSLDIVNVSCKVEVESPVGRGVISTIAFTCMEVPILAIASHEETLETVRQDSRNDPSFDENLDRCSRVAPFANKASSAQ